MHADHHLGLLSIIRERSKLSAAPLVVIGPPALAEWLEEAAFFEEELLQFKFYDARDFLQKGKQGK